MHQASSSKRSRVCLNRSVNRKTTCQECQTRLPTGTMTTTRYAPGFELDLSDIQINDLRYITLVDAGETNQNIPLEPLLIPSRNVDAIIALDNSADTTYSWPNGSALRTTYERALQLETQQNVSIRMPVVPSTNGFVNDGLNTRPVFFGCNETDTPIIVYIPNYPWSYASNISTVSCWLHRPTVLTLVSTRI